MMGFFRRMIGSRIGAFLGLVFLGLVALAFAASDITRRSDGSLLPGSGDTVAKVGGDTLTATDLQGRVQNVFQANQRSNPSLTMTALIAQGGVESILDQVTDRMALSVFAKQNGMVASKKLVDAEIATIPAFLDAAGNFSQSQFAQLLQSQRITEAALRDDLSQQIFERQILQPAVMGAQIPNAMALQYSGMLLEQRKGSFAAFPSQLFEPKAPPSDAELSKFYGANAFRFVRPEQRKIRYALFDTDAFKSKAVPTDAEIAAYYQAHADSYKATEKRTIHQLIVVSESSAKLIAQDAQGGAALDAAAKKAGLATTTLGPVAPAAFAAQTNADAAKAVFAAKPGTLVGPIKTPLGWALFSVAGVQATPAKPLAAARPEIVTLLSTQKQQQALADLANKIDSAIGNGATFDEVVKANGLTATQTPALTSTGINFAAPDQKPDPALGPIVKAAFDMDQGADPQIVQVVPDQKVALVVPGDIVPAGPPKLAEVKDLATKAWALDQGSRLAKLLADKIAAAAKGGTPLDKALATAGIKLPPVQAITSRRADLGRLGNQVPPALVALFSMKQGTLRVVPMPDHVGYMIVRLDGIIPGDSSKDARLISETRTALSGVLAQEYQAQFARAISRAIGVKRSPSGIAKVKANLGKLDGVAQ